MSSIAGFAVLGLTMAVALMIIVVVAVYRIVD
jgi:hypothetical protein